MDWWLTLRDSAGEKGCGAAGPREEWDSAERAGGEDGGEGGEHDG